MNPKWPQEKFNFSDKSWKQISNEENHFITLLAFQINAKATGFKFKNLNSKTLSFQKC